MQTLVFNTTTKTVSVTFNDGSSKVFEDVPTVKVREEGFYEVMQKDEFEEKNFPVLRLPISNTNMEIKR